MKKVLIIGSKGMAGHVIYHFLRNETDFEIIDIARDNDLHAPTYQLDVSEFKRMTSVLIEEMPDVVINCIGVLNKDAEDHPDKSVLLNTYLPHFLAQRGNEIGFKLIHISTDCVFSGQRGSYTESSEKDGKGFYAQTKSLGEVCYGRHLTLRTSIIGPELKDNGIGLFHWFMRQRGKLKGYTKAYWTGVTTLELAKAIIAAIRQDISGLHHLVNDSKINKYNLILLFKTVFSKREIEIEPFDDYTVDKSLIRTNRDFNYSVSSYEVMVEEMKNWIAKYPELYKYS